MKTLKDTLPALEPSAQDRAGAVEAGPEESPAMTRGLEPLCWEERLRDLGLLSLGQRRMRGDLKAASSAWRGCERAGEGLGQGQGVIGQAFKLKEGRFRLDIRKKFFTMRVVRHGLPREAAAAPSLVVSKARLDGAWSSLGW